MMVYKLLTHDQMSALQADGELTGAPVDLADGFVHLSAGHQVAETAAKHFEGVEGLHILALDADTLGDDLRWEPSRGGALFPHLYRKLRLSDVVWSRTLMIGPDGRHRFPEEIGP